MRITNSMITLHSQTNINSTKGLVDTYNEQMTSQKKISKPSDDPVVAVRSLRLRDSLNEVQQYTEKNIPDATSWFEVTETALTNISNNLEDAYKACENAATGTLTTEDRNTLLKNLKSIVEHIYEEGNTDYAGRTVFTGYKTNKTLTFQTETTDIKYEINQTFTIDDVKSKNEYTNSLTVPTNWDDLKDGYKLEDEMEKVTVDRIRLAYGKTASGVAPTIAVNGDADFIVPYTDELGVFHADEKPVQRTVSAADFEASGFKVEQNEILYIPETGELILGSAVSEHLRSKAVADPSMSIEVKYQKDTFSKGEVRPEMYFDCKDITSNDPTKQIVYNHEEQDIEYTVANNQNLKVNTQAGDKGVLSTSIGRDIYELMDAITAAQNANDKVDKIKALKNNSLYSEGEKQEVLDQWLSAAEKEKTFLEDNLKNMFSNGISSFQQYKQTTDLAITDVGSRVSRLELTKTRMTTQKTTIQTLIKDNEDRELSDILIDYKAAYNTYESALKAASKVNELSLLNYI